MSSRPKKHKVGDTVLIQAVVIKVLEDGGPYDNDYIVKTINHYNESYQAKDIFITKEQIIE